MNGLVRRAIGAAPNMRTAPANTQLVRESMSGYLAGILIMKTLLGMVKVPSGILHITPLLVTMQPRTRQLRWQICV